MYEINYEDQRFQNVEDEKQKAIDESNEMYDDMIAKSDDYYKKQINAAKDWKDEQKKLQNEQTDFTIKKIEQQQEEAEKDYIKEQKGAYVDWQKQSNKYGANAEQMASNGLQNSGYAESSQVSMYNTYQNRVATARESWERAKLNYDNAIKEAQLQNSATLAEIAYQGLQQELQLSLQSFQYQNELLMAKASAKTQILNRADTQYQAVLDQMNAENALQDKNESDDGEVEGDDDDVADETPTRTGITLGSVNGYNMKLQKMGFYPNDEILVMDGRYYIRKGDNYVDMTQYIKPWMKNLPPLN